MFSKSLIAAAVLAVSTVLSANAFAADIQVTAPWARASAGNVANGAAYLTLHNSGKVDDRLVSASTDMALKAELHTHMMNNGMMEMRPVDGIDVPAGKTVTLQPGSLHVMLMGLKAPLKKGVDFPLTLVFEKAGTVKIDVHIEDVGSKAPSAMPHDHGGQMKTQ